MTLRSQSEMVGFAQESARSAYQWVMGEPRPCDYTKPLASLQQVGSSFL